MRKLYSILFIYLIVSTGTKAYAQEADFDTTYNIEYSVDTSLETTVKESIGIINQNSSSVISSFIESILNISIYDVKVYDSKDNEMVAIIEEKDGTSIIRVSIENPAIGKDRKTEIKISYKTKDLAQKNGRILNINIPKAPVSNLMQEYNVILKVPKDFGPQISVTPKPAKERMEEEGYILEYNKQTLESYGVSATFGDYQVFNFDLRYKLSNKSVFSQKLEIALPLPIKDYQEVNLTKLEPAPIELKKDGDGNILAVYKVGGKRELDITAQGMAKVYSRIIDVTSSPNEQEISKDYNKYLGPQEFWETRDPNLKQIAQDLTSDQTSVNSKALSIYTYIVNNIEYDYESAKNTGILTRKGAAQTILDKKGLCLDFTDAFIALSRSAGIPTREVDGYAYAKNQDATPVPLGRGDNEFLHSWAQFYSPEFGWISVDPTWGTTSGLDYFSKLDNNHLAFSLNGAKSEGLQLQQKAKVEFSSEEFVSNSSLFDLEKLEPEKGLSTKYVFLGVVVLGLGLCVMLVSLKARSKVR